jgi:CubicO group peptidase (beta-lactamase class C family)
VLSRADKDIDDLTFQDLHGNRTTVKDSLRQLQTDAFLLMKDGRILSEQYFYGMTPRTSHALYSAVKSIEATVVATLLESGQLSVSRPIEKYVPELTGTGYEGATVREILDMRSGIDWPLSEFPREAKSLGPAAEELGVPVGIYNYLPTLKRVREHGSAMVYKNSDPRVLVWASEKVTGMRFADLLSQRIWSRLGMEMDAYVTCDQLCHWKGGFPLTSRDFARWGQMCLRNGESNGEQIVPAWFFEDIRTNARVELPTSLAPLFPDETGYRSFLYYFSKHGHAIAASGARTVKKLE